MRCEHNEIPTAETEGAPPPPRAQRMAGSNAWVKREAGAHTQQHVHGCATPPPHTHLVLVARFTTDHRPGKDRTYSPRVV